MMAGCSWDCWGKLLPEIEASPSWRPYPAVVTYHSEHTGKLTLNFFLKSGGGVLFCCCWCLRSCFSITTMSLFKLPMSGNSNPDPSLVQWPFYQFSIFFFTEANATEIIWNKAKFEIWGLMSCPGAPLTIYNISTFKMLYKWGRGR